jgi:hypothetical protein
MSYNYEELTARGPLEGINSVPGGTNYGGILPVTIAPGASYTYYLPLQTMFSQDVVWYRALFSPIELTVQYNGAASFVSAGVAANLVLSNQSLLFVGYTFANALRNKLDQDFKETCITRYIYQQQQTINIPAAIVAGNYYYVNIGAVPSTCVALIELTRAANASPLTQGVASDFPSTITLNDGAQPVPWTTPQLSGTFWRNIFAGPPVVASPALAIQGYNLYPFTAAANRTIQGGFNLGMYAVSISSQLQLTAASSVAAVEASVVYCRIINVIQRGSELAIKLL